MANRNIQLRVSIHISHGRALKPHHEAENCLEIGEYEAEIFQNREPNYQHVGKSIAEHRRASHAILMHRQGFRTSHRGSVAWQCVAGP